MAMLGLPCVWLGDGQTHGGKATTVGTPYVGTVTGSPSPGAAHADVSVTIAGATVFIAGARQAMKPADPGCFYVVA